MVLKQSCSTKLIISTFSFIFSLNRQGKMATGYALPSLTTVICGVFTAYIIHSAWTLGQLFMPPSCPEYSECLHPLIAQEPKFQVRFKVTGSHIGKLCFQSFCGLVGLLEKLLECIITPFHVTVIHSY